MAAGGPVFRAAFPCLLVAIGLLLLGSGRPPLSDEAVHTRLAWSLVGGAPDAAMDSDWMATYARYPAAQTIATVPAAGLLRLAGVAGPYGDGWGAWHWWTLRLPGAVITAALVAVLAWWIQALGLARRTGAVAAGLVLASLLAPYGRSLFSESLQALLLVATLAGAWSFGRRGSVTPAVVYTLALAALINSKAIYVYAAAPGLWLAATAGRRGAAVAATGAGIALGAMGLLGWNAWKFGDPLGFGYRGQGFTGNPLVGGAGLWLSPGKSLFVYTPWVIASLLAVPLFFRRHRRLALALAVTVAAQTAIHAAWWTWSGDWCWGPRFLVPIIPLLALPAALALRRWSPPARSIALGLVGLSAVVQVPGLLVHHEDYLRPAVRAVAATTPPQANDPLPFTALGPVHWDPLMSPLVGHLWLLGLGFTGDHPHEALAPWQWLRGREHRPILVYEPRPSPEWVLAPSAGGPRTAVVLFICLYATLLGAVALSPRSRPRPSHRAPSARTRSTSAA